MLKSSFNTFKLIIINLNIYFIAYLKLMVKLKFCVVYVYKDTFKNKIKFSKRYFNL